MSSERCLIPEAGDHSQIDLSWDGTPSAVKLGLGCWLAARRSKERSQVVLTFESKRRYFRDHLVAASLKLKQIFLISLVQIQFPRSSGRGLNEWLIAVSSPALQEIHTRRAGAFARAEGGLAVGRRPEKTPSNTGRK